MTVARAPRGVGGFVEMWNRRKGIALLAFVAPVAVAIALAASLPNVYRATATVLVEPAQVQESSAGRSSSEALEARLQTIRERVLSRARLQEVVERFDLYAPLRGRIPDEAVVERMRGNIGMEVREADPRRGGGGTIAFAITFRGAEAGVVTEVANALASMFVQENLIMLEGQTSATAEFLRGQLEEARQRRDEQQRRIAEFTAREDGQLPEQAGAILAALERLNGEIRLNGESQLRALDRREALAEQLAAADAGEGLTPDGSAARLAALHRKLHDLQERYRDLHPDVIGLKQEIAALEAAPPDAGVRRATPPVSANPAVARLRGAIERVDAELVALKAEENGIRRSIDLYQRRAENAGRPEQELGTLSRDQKAAQELFEPLSRRYEDARMAASREELRQGETFRVLDPALPPTGPMGPNRLRLLLIGIVLGVGLAVGGAILAEQVDTSFHRIDELHALGGTAVVLRIPRIVTRSDTRRRRARLALWASATVIGLSLLATASYNLAHGNEDLVWRLARDGR
jgi:polysaccharide chain length determinant protein (PEP-CTERM system associated)